MIYNFVVVVVSVDTSLILKSISLPSHSHIPVECSATNPALSRCLVSSRSSSRLYGIDSTFLPPVSHGGSQETDDVWSRCRTASRAHSVASSEGALYASNDRLTPEVRD